MHDNSKNCGANNALCLKVNSLQEVHVPLVNSTKSRSRLNVGTLIGKYTKIDERDIISPVTKCRKVQIKNELIPESISVVPGQGCTREETLENLLTQQDWSHLDNEQQAQLKDTLIKNHPVFILENNELGIFQGLPYICTYSL